MGLIVAIEHLEVLKAVTLNSTAQPAAGFTFRHGIELLFFLLLHWVRALFCITGFV